jgi:hypothetical protein
MKFDVHITLILRVLHRWLHKFCSSELYMSGFKLIKHNIPELKKRRKSFFGGLFVNLYFKCFSCQVAWVSDGRILYLEEGQRASFQNRVLYTFPILETLDNERSQETEQLWMYYTIVRTLQFSCTRGLDHWSAWGWKWSGFREVMLCFVFWEH